MRCAPCLLSCPPLPSLPQSLLTARRAQVLGLAAKVSISKEATTIVGDGRTQQQVEGRVKQIRNLAAETEQEYEKEKLNERIARLSGGVAIIQVGRRGRGAERRFWLYSVALESLCA